MLSPKTLSHRISLALLYVFDGLLGLCEVHKIKLKSNSAAQIAEMPFRMFIADQYLLFMSVIPFDPPTNGI